MRKIIAIIIEDKLLERKHLIRLIRRIPDLHFMKAFETVHDCFELLRSQQIDVVFLEVESCDSAGLSLYKTLDNPPLVIVVTADMASAFEAFELNAADFIIKEMLTEERLRLAVEKIHGALLYKWRIADEQVVKIKDGHRMLFLKASTIYYAHAYGDYVRLFSLDGELIVLNTLKAILAQLPAQDFIQVHRSFVVNMQVIQSVTSSKVVLIHFDMEIPIGQKFRSAFFTRIGI